MKQATKKCNLFLNIATKLLEKQSCTFNCPRTKPVLHHILFSVTGCKKKNKAFLLSFSLLLASKIHSADVNLRIKAVISKLKQFAIQGRCFALSFSPYKVPLLDLTIESFRVFMLTYNFHNNFQLPDRATTVGSRISCPDEIFSCPGQVGSH